MTARPGRYAAIDIGTVTCRMLLADIDADGLHEITREYAITNLGEGVDATGRLKPEAMRRVAAAIDKYLEVIAAHAAPSQPPATIIAMATSASRDAENAAEFAALLEARGVTLAVIPGEREAALSFLGASAEFSGERLMVLDIGGGSTEAVVGQAGADPLRVRSFNVGCRRVTERFFATDPPTPCELAAARAWITETFAPYFAELRASNLLPQRLVAVAGTATSVVSMRDEMATYDSARVHKATVTRDQLNAVFDRLAAMSEAQRRTVVGLDPQRAPVIVAGLLILQCAMGAAHAAAFTASEHDILHGMILSASMK